MKRNTAPKLNIRSIVTILGSLSRRWLNRHNRYRRVAIDRLVRHSHFSRPMAEAMLDNLFGELTESKLWLILKLELGNPLALDRFVWDRGYRMYRRVSGPFQMTQVFSANLPSPAVSSVVYGLLLKSKIVVKSSSRDDGFLSVYLQSLRACDKNLAKFITCLNPKDRTALSGSASQSQVVVAYGSDQSIASVRSMCPAKTRFFGYGHRVSFSYVGREMLSLRSIEPLIRKTAEDVWMADQRGCLSPAVIYVEKRGEVSPGNFALLLAKQMEVKALNDGPLDRGEDVRARRAALERAFQLKRISDARAFSLKSACAGAWMLFYDETSGRFPISCGHQTFTIRAVDDISSVKKELLAMRGQLQAASLAVAKARIMDLSERLRRLGVARICSPGFLQRPTASWCHEGRPHLGDWVTWMSIESADYDKMNAP